MAWAEDDWERTVPPIELPPTVIDGLLGGLGPARSVTSLPGGKANTNLRIDVDGPPLVLRIYQRDADAFLREKTLWTRVAPFMPVPRCLGEGMTPDGHPVAILPFVDGIHPARALADHPEEAENIGRCLGGCLAGLGRVPVDGIGLYAPDLSLARRFDSVGHSFDDLIRWSLKQGRARGRMGAERRARLRDQLPSLVDALAPLDAHHGLAHGDYKSANLLLRHDGSWSVAAVLDWEFACPFTPMLDIAIHFRHRKGWPDALQVGFETGYREAGGWLPDDWRRLSRIVDLMNLVGFLNASGDRPRLYTDVLAHIDETLRGSR